MSGQPDNLETAAKVYRQLREVICGPEERQLAAGSDKRAIAVLAHVMKPQSYRLPVVSARLRCHLYLPCTRSAHLVGILRDFTRLHACTYLCSPAAMPSRQCAHAR